MLIEGKFRCAACMGELNSEDAKCTCGYDNSTCYNPPHCLQIGGVLSDEYVIGKVIGEGGFGITYVGWDKGLDIKVAIKEYFLSGCSSRNTTVSSDITTSTVEDGELFEKHKLKFVNEAKVLAGFQKENGIVSVYRFFRENNTAYIVMEYVEGITLKEYLKKRGTLTVDETIGMLGPVMRSLAKIHEKNLIHRDISPDNIMITSSGLGKLIDFGAARESSFGNKSLSVVLKHGYAPVEQYQSHGVQGPWTDVYALSATIYRCITGKIPMEAIERMTGEQISTLKDFVPNCNPYVDSVIMKGLSVSKDDRYQTIGELKDALMEALNKGNSMGMGMQNGQMQNNQTQNNRMQNSQMQNNQFQARQMQMQQMQARQMQMQQSGQARQMQQMNNNQSGYMNKITKAMEQVKEWQSANKQKKQNTMAAGQYNYQMPQNSFNQPMNSHQAAQMRKRQLLMSLMNSKIGDVITMGNFYGNREWIVLHKNSKKAMIISRTVIGRKPYEENGGNAEWKKSTLRQWLNSGYIEMAFAPEERSIIAETEFESDVKDKVFLLSADGIEIFLKDNNVKACIGDKPSSWWLRASSPNSKLANYVTEDGEVNKDGIDISNKDVGVRPVMWVNIN